MARTDVGRQPNLLVGFAQRGVLQRLVTGFDRATRQADLARVGRELRVADGEGNDQLVAGGVDEQQGRRLSGGGEVGPVEAPDVLRIQGGVGNCPTRHETGIHWDRPLGGGQGTGEGGLPVPVSP